MQWFRHYSVSRLILLSAVIAVSLPVLLLFLLLRFELDVEAEKQAHQKLTLIAEAMKDPVYYLDPGQVSFIAEAFLKDETLSGIEVKDKVAVMFQKEGGAAANQYTAPIVYEQESVGMLTIWFDKQAFLDSQQLNDMNLALLLFLQGVVTLGVIALVIQYKLRQPISRLMQQTEQLRQGNLKQPFSWESQDELGQLGAALDHSREVLLHSQQQLLQQQSIATIGSTITGIAQEVSNPTSAALMASSSMETELMKLQRDFYTGKIKKSDFVQIIEELTKLSHVITYNMQRLDNTMTSFASITHGSAGEKLDNIALCSHVTNLLYAYREKAKKRKIIIHDQCESEEEIATYPGKLARILSALLSNSFDHAFSSEGGEISLALRVENNRLHIDYRDNGCGMDPAILKTLHEPHFTTKKDEHLGLGFYNIYQLVHELEGTIRVESLPGEGLGCAIELPVEKKRADLDA